MNNETVSRKVKNGNPSTIHISLINAADMLHTVLIRESEVRSRSFSRTASKEKIMNHTDRTQPDHSRPSLRVAFGTRAG